MNVTFPQGGWSFENEAVVDNFQAIAEANIPNYKIVIDKCVQIAERSLSPDSLIVDVGCARGATLEALHLKGFRNLVGIDCSQKMLAKSFSKAKLILSDTFPEELKQVDLVLSNWVLHFIPQRKQYLEQIYRSLRDGGTLVLTEKIAANSEIKDLYYSYKRAAGMSEKEILSKEQGVRGVLVPFSIEWYLNCLKEIGFKDISIVDAHFSFVSFYGKK